MFGFFQDEVGQSDLTGDEQSKSFMAGVLELDLVLRIRDDKIISPEGKLFLFRAGIKNDLFIQKIGSGHHERSSEGYQLQISR